MGRHGVTTGRHVVEGMHGLTNGLHNTCGMHFRFSMGRQAFGVKFGLQSLILSSCSFTGLHNSTVNSSVDCSVSILGFSSFSPGNLSPQRLNDDSGKFKPSSEILTISCTVND